MSHQSPIEAFKEGALSLQELMTQIDRTALGGNVAERTAILDTWRRKEIRALLQPHVVSAIDKKMQEAFGAASPQPSSEDPGTTPTAEQPVQHIGKGYLLNRRFLLDEMLGSGGMGMVFRAIDKRKEEAKDRSPYVAIKLINEDFKNHPDAFIALQREAKKCQTLSHPNIVAVYDFDRDESVTYMTMEYLVGSSLDKIIGSPSLAQMPANEIIRIIQMISAALSFAHENGIVHSDLKPANVFVTESGRVKVIDFGIARAATRADPKASANLEKTIFDAGKLNAMTPAYASIEMILGEPPDVRDDIFALGCISYELFTGKHPFRRLQATEALARMLRPTRPPSLKSHQWKALRRALAFDREKRIGSAAEFAHELSRPSAVASRRPILLGGGGLVLVASAGIYILELVNRGPVQDSLPPRGSEQPIAPLEEAEAQQRAAAAKQVADAAQKAAAEKQAAEAAQRAAAAKQVADAAQKAAAEKQAAEAALQRAAAAKQAADAAQKAAAEKQAAEAAQQSAAAAKQVADAAQKAAAEKQAAEAAQKAAAAKQATDAAQKAAAEKQAAEAAQKAAAAKQAADAAQKAAAEKQAAEAAQKAAAAKQAADAAQKAAAEKQAAEAAQKAAAAKQAADAAQKAAAEKQAAEAAQKAAAAKQAADAAQKAAAEKQAAEAAQRAAAAKQAADAAQKAAAEKQAAEAAQKAAAAKQAADAAQKAAAEKQAAEAAQKAAAAKQAADAAQKAAAEKQAAEAAQKAAAAKQAADAAQKAAAEKQAAEVAQQRAAAAKQVADAAQKAAAEKQAAEAAQKAAAAKQVADAAQKAAAEKQAAEAAQKAAAAKQAADAAQKAAAEKQAAEAAQKTAAAKQAADAAQKAAAEKQAADTTQKLASLSQPTLTPAALMGAWCGGGLRLSLDQNSWTFRLPDGSTTVLPISSYQVTGDTILIFSADNQQRRLVTEFGRFSANQMVQIRGRLESAAQWNNYDRPFTRC